MVTLNNQPDRPKLDSSQFETARQVVGRYVDEMMHDVDTRLEFGEVQAVISRISRYQLEEINMALFPYLCEKNPKEILAVFFPQLGDDKLEILSKSLGKDFNLLIFKGKAGIELDILNFQGLRMLLQIFQDDQEFWHKITRLRMSNLQKEEARKTWSKGLEFFMNKEFPEPCGPKQQEEFTDRFIRILNALFEKIDPSQLIELDISYNSYNKAVNHNALIAIGENLSKCPNLEVLDLSGTSFSWIPMNEEGDNPTLAALEKMKRLKILKLRNIFPLNGDFSALMYNNNLIVNDIFNPEPSVRIEENNDDDENYYEEYSSYRRFLREILPIARLLAGLRDLESLDLSDNRILTSQVHTFFQTEGVLPKLKELILRDTFVQINSAPFVEAIQNGTNEVFIGLFKFLRETPIENLTLQKGSIDLNFLISLLNDPSKLKKLDLEDNQFRYVRNRRPELEPEGFVAADMEKLGIEIAEEHALSVDALENLEDLNLAKNWFWESDFEGIMASLPETLKSLNLSGIKFERPESEDFSIAEQLMVGIEKSGGIEKLNLKDVSLNKDELFALLELLSEQKSIENLVLDCRELETSDMEELYEYLLKLDNLEELDLYLKSNVGGTQRTSMKKRERKKARRKAKQSRRKARKLNSKRLSKVSRLFRGLEGVNVRLYGVAG